MPKRRNAKNPKNGGRSKSRSALQTVNQGQIVQQHGGGGGSKSWSIFSSLSGVVTGVVTLAGLFGSANAEGGGQLDPRNGIFPRDYCKDIFDKKHDDTNQVEVLRLLFECGLRMQSAYDDAVNSSSGGGGADAVGADSVVENGFFNNTLILTTMAGIFTAVGFAASCFLAGRCNDNAQSEIGEKDLSEKSKVSKADETQKGSGGSGKENEKRLSTRCTLRSNSSGDKQRKNPTKKLERLNKTI